MSIEQWSDLMFPEREGKDAHVYGSVKAINEDGSYEVQLNASSVTTRCAPCCTALVGDRVLVIIKLNGKCDAIGRLGGEIGGGGGAVAGQIFAYAGTDEPSGALLCDGSEVSRVEYSELFAAIGTTYGEGDGSTTFNLPNLEGRLVVGESDDFAFGDVGGEAEHTLTVDELPAHQHSLSRSMQNASDEASNYGLQSGGGFGNRGVVTGNKNGATYATNTGGDQPHNNMPPYVVMRWFITTGQGTGSSGGGGGETVTYAAGDVSDWIAGKVFPYAGTDEPIGSLPCDGRAVSRRAYWELFEAIGTTYGEGDGESTFNLPNIESRTIIGESDSYALGSTGGESEHTLTEDEMAHVEGHIYHHGMTETGTGGTNVWKVDGAFSDSYPQNSVYRPISTTSASSSSVGCITLDIGGDAAHNNMQPYIVMRYFITTGKGDPVSGINPADYPVERGVTDGWVWKKWASGEAECWKSVSQTVDITTTYNSYASFAWVGGFTYPIEFAEVPSINCTPTAGGVPNLSVGNKALDGFSLVVSNPAPLSAHAVEFDIHIKGKWKELSETGGTETIAPTIEEKFTELAKAKTWVFAIRDRGNTETQGGGSTASAGWFNTTCGYKINGTDDWEDYFYTTKSTTYFTLNKPGQYRCTFTAHFALSAAGRLGVGWFQGSTEVASNFVWCGSTAGHSSTVELVIDVTDPVSITPMIFVSGQVPTKYVGGHLTNFTIEYLGEL